MTRAGGTDALGLGIAGRLDGEEAARSGCFSVVMKGSMKDDTRGVKVDPIERAKNRAKFTTKPLTTPERLRSID